MATKPPLVIPTKTAGFGPFDLGRVRFKGQPIGITFADSISNIIVQRTMNGVATLTIQITDPTRKILNQFLTPLAASISRNHFNIGGQLEVDGLSFTFVQFVKASDMMQLVFESTAINRLRHQRGQTKQTTNTAVTQFMAQLAGAVGYKLVGPDYATTFPLIEKGKRATTVTLGRGTSTDANEDSWTCMSRIASSIGWRLWESADKIYFGPDEYWLGNLSVVNKHNIPPINKAVGRTLTKTTQINEFTREVQLVDYDWDVGKPYAQCNVTCMLDSWDYQLGEVVKVNNIGPGSGNWLVYSMQRDLFLPTGTLVLQVPAPIQSYTDPTSLPLAGFPLDPTKPL
jgi:hypothetical protein